LQVHVVVVVVVVVLLLLLLLSANGVAVGVGMYAIVGGKYYEASLVQVQNSKARR